MRVITSDHRSPRFSASKEPALRVQPGEIVRMVTAREPTDLLIADGDDWLHIELDTINLVTGPVYIEGVEPGDGVAVEILDIETLDWGVNAYFPGFSLVASRLYDPFRRKTPIVDGWMQLTDQLKAPLQPMIGCLELAPAEGESTTFGKSPWGGHYDLTQMRAGNTAIFPAQTPGGLFYLGDLHAVMGAGEPTYVAIECAGAITVRFGIRKGLKLATPRIETSDRFYIVGLTDDEAREDRWETSRRQASELMFDYLTIERGLLPEQTYLLISACVDLSYGGPAGSRSQASRWRFSIGNPEGGRMVTLTREGYVPVSGGRVWYQIVGEGDGVPLLTLHGGPGAGHNNLEPLAALAADRPVVFYDQMGCGRSDKPDDLSLWRIERYVAEIDALRDALGLERIHLYGQSWGGWLAIEYMMGRPPGIASLILSSAAASNRQFLEETARLRATLPEELQATLQRYEAAGDYHHPEYERAVMAFLGPLFCRLDPFPELIWRTVEIFNGDRTPYETIWGPNDFIINGNLKGWDRSDRLGEIAAPTLVMCGRYDEVTPACAETLHRGIADSELHIFENSAHMAHLEETEEYLRVMCDFLARIEMR